MSTLKTKVTEVTIGKSEAGMYEYTDTGKSIEMGEKAYTIKRENIMTDEIETLYFTKKENAENFK